MTQKNLSDEYEKVLRDAGLRVTRARKIILDVLSEGTDHPDAQEIFTRAAKRDARISLATVYRTMKQLEQSGAIQRHSFHSGPARFETTDQRHHDHLIDVDTGQVLEFRSEKIEKLQEEIARELGYELVDHKLELYGRKRRITSRTK